MTGWGNKWLEEAATISQQAWDNINVGIDLAKPNSDKSDLLGLDTSSNAAVHAKNLKSQGSNLVDAEAYLYFQCEACQTILDPHTRSFAELQQNRVDAGWKCVWNTNGLGYNVYCDKCEDWK